MGRREYGRVLGRCNVDAEVYSHVGQQSSMMRRVSLVAARKPSNSE